MSFSQVSGGRRSTFPLVRDLVIFGHNELGEWEGERRRLIMRLRSSSFGYGSGEILVSALHGSTGRQSADGDPGRVENH